MKKILISMILILLVLPTVLSLDIEVEKKSTDVVMIKGLNESLTFDLQITNNGPRDNINFYNLVGFLMSPEKPVSIDNGETKNVELVISPIEPVQFKGLYQVPFFIKGQNGEEIEDGLFFEIIELNEAFEIKTSDINPESKSTILKIKNKVNFDFKDLNMKFDSNFFSEEKTISLAPEEEKEFTIILDKEDFKEVLAGYYTLKTTITAGSLTDIAESKILFSEQDLLEKEEKKSGWIIQTTRITKANTGNIVMDSVTVVQKDIISRLFTSFNPTPDLSERQGLSVYYTWDDPISPGEQLVITVKTNWILPVVLILLIILAVILAKQYSTNNLVLKKKIAFVRTKGGEFALKVTIVADAKRTVEKVTITDKLPSFVKLYENYGSEVPKRVDDKNKKLEWSFESIHQGSSRTMSYIVYSKIGFLGKFGLPTAKAVYEKSGKIRETESNRAYFLTEQKKEEEK